MAISAQWADLLEPGLREIFEVQRDALAAQSVIPALFNQIGSSKAAEHFLGAGSMSDWDEYKGERKLKEKWINAPGVGMKQTVEGNDLHALSAMLKGKILAVDKGGHKPAAKKSAREEPPPPTDKDIGF